MATPSPARDDRGQRHRRQADPERRTHPGTRDLGPLFSRPALQGGSIDARFNTWIEKNPRVLRRFIELSLQLRAKGHRRVSAKMVMETMRCEWMLRTTGDAFKLNNDYTSRLARLSMTVEPRLEGMFETRQLSSREES